MATCRGTAVNIAAYNTIRKRMRDAQLDTGTMVHDATFFLMHQDHCHNTEAVAQVQQIMEDNTTFTDEQLMQHLAIAPEPTNRSRIPLTTYYLCSWRVPPQTMRMIFDQWADQVELTATDVWFARLLENPNDDMYIRYVGMTDGTALNRHVQDTRGQVGGLIGKFYDTLQRVDPATFNNVHIYYFYRTTATERSFFTQRMRDMREQIIIAFFGMENLFNTQYGGQFASYQQNPAQMGRLEQYRSRFFSLFRQHATAQHDQHILQPWIERVVDGALHSMEHDLLEMMLDQALPRTVGGYTILVFLGNDITIADFDTAQ